MSEPKIQECDFIIVGRGLAATALMHVFSNEGISFKTIGNLNLSKCSMVAAGIWNPIVFKRLTKSWMADELIQSLKEFYSDCEEKLGIKFMSPRKIIRPFTEEQEIELWKKKSKNELDEYLDPKIYSSENAPHPIKTKLGFGLVLNAGSINTATYIKSSTNHFDSQIRDEEFEFSYLELITAGIRYKNLKAKNIIFCEGYLVKDNPYFKWIPLKPAKGEVLHVEIPGSDLGEEIVSKSVFVMKSCSGNYKVGATYNWQDLSEEITSMARIELEDKLKDMLHTPYQIKLQEAGVRPSSIDRRPIIGAHPKHKNMFVFNGLGTKGVMLAPFFAKNFVNFYLQKEELQNSVLVNRFYHLFVK